MTKSFENDARQLFSYGVLSRLDRVGTSGVKFTFDPGEIYMSAFHEAMAILDSQAGVDRASELLRFAKVFEQLAITKIPGVSVFDACLVASSLYWLSGFTANAKVLSRLLRTVRPNPGPAAGLLLRIFERDLFAANSTDETGILAAVSEYVKTGAAGALESADAIISRLETEYLSHGQAEEFVAARLAQHVLIRLRRVSFWSSIENASSAPDGTWKEYAVQQIGLGNPVVDLWPSQRNAIAKGLLDGRTSLVITTPTSSGKTRMAELALVNDLYTYPTRKCLFVAPFRALIGEIESAFGATFAAMGISIASLYGGADANELDVELSNRARVTIATPEKIAAVLRLSNRNLSEYKTVVLDEGHLLDSQSRGPAYEFQLASLRAAFRIEGRAIFLSAVLPNPDDIALYLGGAIENSETGDWQPTTTRLGVVTWPKDQAPRLDFRSEMGQPLTEDFFVPRLFEQEERYEVNPRTGRANRAPFPVRGNNGSIAAALALDYVRLGAVIVYATRPAWTVSVGEAILSRIGQQAQVRTRLIDDSNRVAVAELGTYFRKRMGECTLTNAVENGFALHHGGIPQSLRAIIEDAYRKQTIRLLVATNTVAQGVNFPAKTILVHSFPVTSAPIRDFWNLVGRAGRANMETEGEVLILKTGTMRDETLRRFLDKSNMERAEGRILSFVRLLLEKYPVVSRETIDAALGENGVDGEWGDLVRSIDSHLLEHLAEDLGVDDMDPQFVALANDLFSVFQAARLDLRQGGNLEIGVRSLLIDRRARLLQRIPSGAARKRIARTGLSVDSALTLADLLPEVRQIVAAPAGLDSMVFARLIGVACQATELREYDVEFLSSVGYAWISTGNYGTVFQQNSDILKDIDETVSIIENVVCYRLSWVMSGILSLVDEHDGLETPTVPEWMTLMPQYLQHGVNSRELVWIQSIGIQQREFAEFILDLCRHDLGGPPSSFRLFLDWLLDSAKSVTSAVQSAWPAYFVDTLSRAIARYTDIRSQLTQ